MCWWLRNGLAGWFVLTLIWGAVSIIYDTLIEILTGTRNTISWQTQQAALANPVIPAAVGLIVGGLAVHFFRVRALAMFDASQPWLYYAAGFVAGAVLVGLTWTQRG